MPPAARITDMHTCPMVTGVVPHVGGPILPPCHPTTLIGFLPAARIGDMLTCVGPPDTIVKGSPTVLIGNMPAARMGDNTAHGGVIVLGHPTTMIGDAGSGGGGGGAAAPAPPAPASDAGQESGPAGSSGPSGEEVGPMLVQAAQAGTALLRRQPPAPVAEEQTHTLKIRVVINDTDQAVKGLKLLITRPGQKKEEQVEEPHVTDPEGRIEIDDLEKGGSVKVRCELEGARLSHTYDYVGKGEEPLPVQSKDSEPRGLREASAEWRLANIKEHKVNTGETLDGIARANGMTWKELAEFNWGTSKPKEINEHLRDYVGCTKKTKDGNNYMFDSSDKPGIVYIPKEWKDSLATDTPKEHTIRVRELNRMLMHMYLDANRDGDADDVRSALNKKWEWGKDKKGAVILVNNDDDDDSNLPDNEDDEVNGNDDKNDLAPLEFKRFGPPTPPPGWKAELRVSDKSKIRIFDAPSSSGKVIIGPDKGDTYDFKDDLSPKEWKFWMEATQYAHKAYRERPAKKAKKGKKHNAFSGTIRLTLKLTAPTGKTYEEWADVRVAPWLMPNHLDKAEKVHVTDIPGDSDSSAFRAALKPLVKGATGSDPDEYQVNDQWMQDCMEIGYSALPKHAIKAVMRSPRDMPLLIYPQTLLAKEFGYHEKGDLSEGTNLDSHGNLEVTPPFKSKDGKKNYPWGRIYFGGVGRKREEYDPEVRAFLEGQVVQKPISVDSTWLAVGHVDEFISFVPGGAKGFTMLLASPKRAYKILDDNLIPYGGTLKLLTKLELGGHSVETSILSFLVDGVPHHTAKGKGKELRKFNEGIQSKIDKTRAQFKRELELEESDIFDAPVLFMPCHNYPTRASALTADMVNMLVVNKHCIFPKPFGPVVNKKDLFEEELTKKLKVLGLTPHAIDDWNLYHAYEGEVHCGTNTTREAKEAKWWEFKPESGA